MPGSLHDVIQVDDEVGPSRWSASRVVPFRGGNAGAQTSAPTGGCLAYEPSVVSLTGTVRKVPAYGPPNYGESPKTDSREDYATLHLDRPICTRAAPGDVMNASQADLRDLQLVFTGGAPRSLVGAKVTVTGTLFSAQTGHHHTKVLLTVANVAR